MAWTRTRSPVITIVLIGIVIATSIALRKGIPDQASRIAVGIVEVVLIATLVRGIVRPR